MRYAVILGFLCFGTLSLISGCSSDLPGTSGGDGGNGNASSSSSSGDGGSTSSSSGMASSSSSSSGGGVMVNGCDSATAEDHTADAAVTVTFGNPNFAYSPACIRVKKGTMVTFQGNFTMHPIVGGTTTAGMAPQPDPTSPIKPTASGTTATFTMDTVGNYPYYCEIHLPSMAGAVFVE